MPPATTLPVAVQRDLRSDHAGETGAVFIYRGILHCTRDSVLREFATEHLATEERHLAFFEHWLPPALKSRLLPLWKVGGWSLGALALLGGRRGVFLTIEAVETFVVAHYREQLPRLRAAGQEALVTTVCGFMDDEAAHRDDAASRRVAGPYVRLGRFWCALVGSGSAAAVAAARRL
ncbi:demethoxyubiquinone hydroxylase family protein [Candidatus Litorirhabdus singularis]|uniref:demethoxyubiquinone hydroxylase family protein n=1 Tax=Candidatus Litorirhabdus singularis TaxID=2518993 RepID=UPI00242C84E2|nr:demethoxyubiquinone hydroxylase family protein [Candidatus Litorirhabdus singularis]